MSIPNNLGHKYDSSLPVININTGNANTSTSGQITSTILNSVFGVGMLALTGAMKGGSSAGTQQTQQSQQSQEQVEQAKIQQWENQALSLARTTSFDDLKNEVKNADLQIQELDTQMGEWADLARGGKSEAITSKEKQVQEYETKYGFGSGVDKTTETAKEGSAYAEAQKTVETLESKINNLTEDNSGIDSRLIEIEAKINANDLEIKDIPKQITSLEQQRDNLKPPVAKDDSAGEKAKLRPQLKAYENKKETLNHEIQQLTEKKAQLEKSNNELTAEKTKITERQKENKDKLPNLKTKLDTARAEADKKSTAKDGTNLEAKYEEYKNAKKELAELRGKATRAQAEFSRLESQRDAIRLSRDMNARALEYKEKISSDDAKALKNYGDVSGKNDGNWFSRNLGWLWGKGKTAKAFRANRKERNEYINTYMQDYGVSKKDAKKALNLLSMNNNSTSGTQSAQSNNEAPKNNQLPKNNQPPQNDPSLLNPDNVPSPKNKNIWDYNEQQSLWNNKPDYT